jgi:hypothetical protein
MHRKDSEELSGATDSKKKSDGALAVDLAHANKRNSVMVGSKGFGLGKG